MTSSTPKCFHRSGSGGGTRCVTIQEGRPHAGKHTVKSKYEPKGKEKLFSEEPIIDNNEDEESVDNELQIREVCEAEMDEHQRRIHKAEAKEKIECEAQVTLDNGKLLFPEWNMK
ncbi:unnamed protein product [Lactuca saligna]|uniref:Uncharacterized protein n=1 Tax=Lactuca saligna TaxID=75948 RepID=A0AA35VLM7_LACSI|nr:unnamed protein product [Lactuca saligna]